MPVVVIPETIIGNLIPYKAECFAFQPTREWRHNSTKGHFTEASTTRGIPFSMEGWASGVSLPTCWSDQKGTLINQSIAPGKLFPAMMAIESSEETV